MPSPTRLLVVDEQEMVLAGLVEVLRAEPALNVVGTATSIPEAVQLITELEPEITVTNYELPGGSGVSLAREGKGITKVLVVAAQPSDQKVAAAAGAGCGGFVSTGEGVPLLVAAIRLLAAGYAVYPADRLPAVMGGDAASAGLSPRELEVLQLVAQSMSVSAIAEQLFLSPHTVRNHIRNITTKLNAHTKLEAVVKAVASGLITLD